MTGLRLDSVGDLPVGAGASVRNSAQLCPYALLEVGTPGGERGRLLRLLTGEVPVEP